MTLYFSKYRGSASFPSEFLESGPGKHKLLNSERVALDKGETGDIRDK
jgi:hypothetical protein